MNRVNKRALNNLKSFFSNVSKRIAFLVSLSLLLTLSAGLISSLFLSDVTLQKLGQSNYFKSKVKQVLEKNKVYPEGLISINLNKFSSAEINIEKANIASLKNVVGHQINFKVDFIKYWFGLSFIDEVFIKELEYTLPNNVNLNLEKAEGLNLKFVTRSFRDSLNKINSESVFIERCILSLQNSTFDFNEIYISKNENSLHAKANLKLKPNFSDTTFTTNVNLSLKDANIIQFNINLPRYNFDNFFQFDKLPKNFHLFFVRLFENGVFPGKKTDDIRLVGKYDLNSNYLNFGLQDLSNRIKLNSSLEVLESLKSKNLFFGKTELNLEDFSIIFSKIKLDFTSRSFETNGTKFLIAQRNVSILPRKVKVFGVFPFEAGIISKINIEAEDSASLKASLDILEPKSGLDKNGAFELFLHIDKLEKLDFNNLQPLLKPFLKGENKELSFSNVNALIGLNFKTKDIEIKLLKGKIDNLIYGENSKPLVELENIDFEGSLKQGNIAISSINEIGFSKNRYKDITLEISSTDSIELDREITLSFKSRIVDLVSLVSKKKDKPKWIKFLSHSQGDNEVSVMYSKAISLNRIDKFLSPEENMFEINVENFSVPINDKRTLNLDILNLKGIGNTIFFEGSLAAGNRKIKGSVNNWLSSFLGDGLSDDIIISFEDLDSEAIFPNFSAFYVKGPVELSFSFFERNDDTSAQSIIDLTNTDVYIPALALKKRQGKEAQLTLNFTNSNKFNFKYSQNAVLVTGSVSHESIFEIKKVNYSRINTPDIKIEDAIFQKFGEYNQFKANNGLISLEFLMRLNIKKKTIPIDFIFNNILVTFKKNKFLGSVKGEVRSFKGLRGYAKAELSSKSNLDFTISPSKNNAINILISGGDAGELLRRGKYYRNGYGGMFKASILYENKAKISGSLEIEDFRIKNAPVLAQIISSASIIGLLDNLNGNGLLFTKIEGNFDYNDGELILEDGVAVGPSLGLTMSGYERYGKKQNVVDVNGLISPVYIVNGVVKAIPLIGRVLGGEKGEGVFGVSYKVQGNSSNPRVLVNPLSILTPGVLRKIFSINENVNDDER